MGNLVPIVHNLQWPVRLADAVEKERHGYHMHSDIYQWYTFYTFFSRFSGLFKNATEKARGNKNETVGNWDSRNPSRRKTETAHGGINNPAAWLKSLSSL